MSASIAREWVKKAILGSGVLRVTGALAPRAAVILMYHSVQERPEEFADSIGTGIIHSASVFDRQMELLARRFNPVDLLDVLLFLNGEKDLPPRPVAVTFDDGFADNSEIAVPILARYGIRGAFYLTTSLIGTRNPPWYARLRFAFTTSAKGEWINPEGRKHVLTGQAPREKALLSAFDMCAPLADGEQETMVARIESDLDSKLSEDHSGPPLMMSWDQVKRLARHGHLIGSHTLTHPNLAYVKTEEVLRRELTVSKQEIEEATHSSVEHFSYPHPALSPQWTEKTVAMTRLAGYRSAVTTTSGPVTRSANPLHLTRIGAPRPEHQFLWNLERTLCGYKV
jgi:peptidoglycan/xylan/chitin deacetylase (PgdA/CDA1 family)